MKIVEEPEAQKALLPSDLWAIGSAKFGNSGVIMRFDGAGNVITKDPGGSATLKAIWGASASDIWVVGNTGTILHSDGSGTWTSQVSGTNKNLFGVWAASPTDIWAVGEDGLILHSDGSGTWSLQESGVIGRIFGIWGNSSNSVVAVGANNTLLHYDGVRWPPVRPLDAATATDYRAVWGGDNELFIGGTSSDTLGYIEYLHRIAPWD